MSIEHLEETLQQRIRDWFSKSVNDEKQKLVTRIVNALLKADILYMFDLVRLSRHDLSRVKGVGPVLIKLVENTLKKNGLQLGVKIEEAKLTSMRQRAHPYLKPMITPSSEEE